MTKSELIEALEQFPNDHVVIIKESEHGGWDNIRCVYLDRGSAIVIESDGGERPFKSE